MYHSIIHMNYTIQGEVVLVNEKGEEQPIKADDFALVLPAERQQYRNKVDRPLMLICGVPKEFDERIDWSADFTTY